MPYKAVKRGTQWMVYKLDADGMPMGKALGTHPTQAAAQQQVKALYANAPDMAHEAAPEVTNLLERTFTQAQRDEYAKSGVAMADGSYPIPDRDALERAIQSFGHSPDQATKNHIIKRARVLGLVKILPPDWNISEAKSKMGDVHEMVDLSEAETDSAEFMIRNATLIKAGWSLNHRYYPDRVLAEAASLWEGVRAYADHPTKQERKDRPERSIRDIVGVYENVRHESPQTKADLRIIGKAREWLWPLLEESIQRHNNVVTLSINGFGHHHYGEAEGKRGSVVEAIEHANSVDVVTTAAAGGGFSDGALMMSDDGWTVAVLEAVTLDELREARPDLISDLKREYKTTRDTKALREAHARAEQAEQRAAQMAEGHRVTEAALTNAQQEIAALKKELLIDRLFAEHKLPNQLKETLRGELLHAQDEAAIRATFDQALNVLAAVRLPVRVTGAGVPAASRPRQPNQGKPANPLVESLAGVDARLAKAETLEEFIDMQHTLNEEGK